MNGQGCANPVIRKEIRELSQNELTSYVNAVRKLHNTYQPQSPLSDFEMLSKLHDNSNNYIHHDPSFLPWHREFLFQYETKLRLIDPTIVLPYWDWTLDYEFPHESVVLSKYIMGSNGDLNNDNCLSNGPFANTVLNYASDQDPHCLRRSYNAGQNITAFMPPEVFITLTNEPKFSYFSFSLEVFHGYPHDGIGGDYGDFSTMYSPSDPLFYLHHGFIDMLFSKWQLK
ncbi:Di-copper centre-containing protein, partial [Neoconidiobolus thromboides FSU 785]